jgi:ABC-type iron transport system FetAB ATPase subunit
VERLAVKLRVMRHDLIKSSDATGELPSDYTSVSAPRLSIRDLQSAHAGPVSLEPAGGECVAIVGESGSGKSVLLRMIADLDPNSGTVLLDGIDREQWAAPEWRSKVIYQPAEPAWWEACAQDHLPRECLAMAEKLAVALRLRPGSLQAELTTLSTGERQRLALIRSLARRPRTLLLDESASALDSATTLAVEAVLRAELQQGLAILIVTHSEQQAERLAQRRLRMVAGRLEVA